MSSKGNVSQKYASSGSSPTGRLDDESCSELSPRGYLVVDSASKPVGRGRFVEDDDDGVD